VVEPRPHHRGRPRVGDAPGYGAGPPVTRWVASRSTISSNSTA
jgi:hypothetical protein